MVGEPTGYDLVKWAFGCVISPDELQSRYDSLHKGGQVKLVHIADMMKLATLVRYHVKLQDRYDISVNTVFLGNRDLPALEVQLLFSGLDAMTELQVDTYLPFKRFPEWLNDQPEVGPFSKEEIANLYTERYEATHGVTRRLRKLFVDLPAATKKWLQAHVSVRRKSNGAGFDKCSEQEFLRRLFDFFFEKRNLYTHGAITHAPYSSRNSGYRRVSKLIDLAFAAVFRETKSFGIKMLGRADEALILRTILYSSCLQRLGLDDEFISDDLIAKYVSGLLRQQFMYEATEDIYQNTESIAWWSEADQFIPSELYHIDIAPVEINSIYLLVEGLNRTTLEAGIRKTLGEYIEASNKINQRLASFSAERTKSSGDWEAMKAEIVLVLAEIVKTDEYKTVVHMPTSTTLSNLVILARDPW